LIGAVPIPFPINPDQACGHYGFDCPLKTGNKYTLTISLPVKNEYPKMKVGVRLILDDEKNKEKIVCTKFPAQIK